MAEVKTNTIYVLISCSKQCWQKNWTDSPIKGSERNASRLPERPVLPYTTVFSKSARPVPRNCTSMKDLDIYEEMCMAIFYICSCLKKMKNILKILHQ